jgi:hypothetical protein
MMVGVSFFAVSFIGITSDLASAPDSVHTPRYESLPHHSMLAQSYARCLMMKI